MEKVLVIAAHPDEEILGCGGSIIEHIKQKDKVGIIIAAEGITSRDNSRNIKKREKEVQKLHFVFIGLFIFKGYFNFNNNAI